MRSNSIARPREYLTVLFRNCYYLWKIADTQGETAATKVNERTLRTYVGRVDATLPEAVAYRDLMSRGKQ